MTLRARFLLFALLVLTLCSAGGAAHALEVTGVRFGQHPGKTRMVLDLTAPAAFRAFVTTGPDRLLIDLPAYGWRADHIDLRAAAQATAIRQGPLQDGINRIVVDMSRPVAISSAFILPAAQGLPNRLVIDFAPGAGEPGRVFGTLRSDSAPAQNLAAASKPAQVLGTLPVPPALPAARQDTPRPPPVAATGAATPPARKPAAANSAPPPAMALRGEKPVIVIDAGHGGVDPGAIGANGIFEKNITLAMARELRQILEGTGRYTVYLTRDSDKFLRLYQRVDIARQKNADLFISIHADTIGKRDVRGVSIYTLSETASDRETAELAERENKVDLIAGADLSHADKDIAQILVGMAMRDTMNQSKFFANTTVDKMRGDGLRLLERPHRYAGFAVLKAPDVPSVLIEIGFMSNNTEAQLLNDPQHRHRLGQALARSIDAYFDKVRRNGRS